jgi:DNA invertase Pin-like site-specific DNA recombinase
VRAAIYTRPSLDRGGDEIAIERQLAECRRLCDKRGYTVSKIISDNNKSATTGDRPGFEELLRLIEHKAVDVVVVLRIDRLLRPLAELETFIELSECPGVPIATVDGDVDLGTPSGRLVGRLLASVARAEVEMKSERHKLANLQKARAGKPHGAVRPDGYGLSLLICVAPISIRAAGYRPVIISSLLLKPSSERRIASSFSFFAALDYVWQM